MADPQSTIVFVSHSSQDKPLTDKVCTALAAALPAAQGFRILVDNQDLKPSQEWPRYLIEWMARCHCAVILLTESAIKSDWVLKEATLLTARRTVEDSFALVPVRFDKTEHLLKEHGYDPLFLNTYQGIQFTNIAALVDKVKSELAKRSSDATPFEALAASLADLLERVGSNALRTVSGKLTQFEAVAVLKDDRARWIDNIATHLVCGHLGALDGVHDLVDCFNTSDAEVVRKILRFVAPYWVDPLAAQRLLRLAHQQPRHGAALNGSRVFDFTAKLYVQRAHQPSKRFEIILVDGGNHDDYAAHVRAVIAAFVRKDRPNLKDHQQVAADLAKRRAALYALLPSPLPDDEVLNAVMDEFPTITFILWTGERLNQAGPFSRVERLEPEVDLLREDKEERDWFEAKRLIDEMGET